MSPVEPICPFKYYDKVKRMDEGRLVKLVVFPGWLVGVTYRRSLGYRCWVINPDMAVLNDGELYSSSAAALEAGRLLVQHSTDLWFDSGWQRQQE